MMRLPWDPKISFPYGVDPSYVQNEDDEEESENRYFQDIKNFLNGLKLKHLIPIFHENDIKMKKLLLITSEELINVKFKIINSFYF